MMLGKSRQFLENTRAIHKLTSILGFRSSVYNIQMICSLGYHFVDGFCSVFSWLLIVSSVMYIAILFVNGLHSDWRYLLENLGGVIDTIVLFLMFAPNQKIFNNLCGCFARYCSLCFGSEYAYNATRTDDETEHESDVTFEQSL